VAGSRFFSVSVDEFTIVNNPSWISVHVYVM